MTQEESKFFELLDCYARSKYRCFLAEMNLNRFKANYTLCFRPTGGGKDSLDRYACRYLSVGVEVAGTAGQRNALPIAGTEMLDSELSMLRRS